MCILTDEVVNSMSKKKSSLCQIKDADLEPFMAIDICKLNSTMHTILITFEKFLAKTND